MTMASRLKRRDSRSREFIVTKSEKAQLRLLRLADTGG